MTRPQWTRGLRLAPTSGFLAAFVWLAPTPASAATITVTETLDVRSADGRCSLREAIDSANNDSAPFAGGGECAAGAGADLISLPAGPFELSITDSPGNMDENANAGGDLDVLGTELTIAGAGATATRIDGKGIDRVLDIRPGRTAVIRDVTVTGGHARNGGDGLASSAIGGAGSPGASGGAIRNEGVSLTIEDAAITDNTAGTGGAGGLATGTDASSGANGSNASFAIGGAGGDGGAGGGIFTSGELTLRRATVARNIAGNGGAGTRGTGGQGGAGSSGTGGTGGLGNGGAGGDGGSGGGIAAADPAQVMIEESTVAGNVAGMGGAGGPGQGGAGGVGQTGGGTGGSGYGGPGGAGGSGGGMSGAYMLSVVASTFDGNSAGPANIGGNGTGGDGGGAVGAGGNGGTGGNGTAGAGGAGGGGGGVEVAATSQSASLTNSTVASHTASSGAAAGTGKGGKGGGSVSGSGGNGGSGNGSNGGNAGRGGGLLVGAGLIVRHATLSSNSLGSPGPGSTGVAGAGGSPGGSAGGTTSGISGTPGYGGGVFTSPGGVSLTNSIVAGNAGASCDGISSGNFGHNVVYPDSSCPGAVADPQLSALADNGGATRTQALGPASPAIDAVPVGGANCAPADQRGVARPFGGGCDSGAYERSAPGVVTGDATAVSLSGATLQGEVAPNGTSAQYRFEFGTSTAYGTTTASQGAPGAAARPVTATVGGLAPATTYHFRLVATNAEGTSSGADRTFTTLGLPGGGGLPGGDAQAPTFLSASLAPKVFAVDRRGPREVAVAAAKGTTIRYTLSEAARVTVTIERRTPGRKVKGKCRKQTRANRRKPACKLWVRAGRFAVASVAGANRKKFSGRIGRRVLGPGTYRAVLVATDAAGNASAPKRLGFKVVRR